MLNFLPSFVEQRDTITGIQPLGFMFILNAEKKVIQISRNVEGYLSQPPEYFIFKNILEFLTPQSGRSLESFFQNTSLTQKTFFEVRFHLKPDTLWLGNIYRNDEGFIFEVEKNEEKVDFTFFETILDTSSYLSSLETLDDIYNSSIEKLKEITGHERVVFFRFNDLNLGKVVAQSPPLYANHEDNLYYDYLYSLPALKHFNSIIYLPDLNFEPVGFYPGVPVGKDFITASQLWCTTESFIKFLKAQKAASFIGINIIINKDIWGRFACFHPESKEISHFTRQKLTFLGQMIASSIATKLVERSTYRDATFQILLAKLSEGMSVDQNYVQGLRNSIDSLLRLGNADAVAWNLEGKTECFGNSPSREKVEEIVNVCWKLVFEDQKTSVYLDSLSLDFPEFRDVKSLASGLLFLPIALQEQQYIVWFRREKIAHVHHFENGTETQVKKKLEGLSEPWTKEDVDNAHKFKNNLTNYIIQNSARLKLSNKRLEKIVSERTNVLEKEIKMRRKAESVLNQSLEELKRSNSELENFAYVASHDLQEPLRKIQAFSDRLKILTQGKLDEKSEDYFNRMTAAAKRMQKLINDLLSFSRVATHIKPFETIDLNELFQGVISDLQVNIEEKDAKILVDKFKYTVKGDINQLHRVFQNLIQNALKFSKKDTTPEIIISALRQGKTYVISVKDNGIGFDKEYSSKIFQLFERLHGRSEFEGTGLGLAICKKIIERHRGKIASKSELGKGAEFLVELPISSGENGSV